MHHAFDLAKRSECGAFINALEPVGEAVEVDLEGLPVPMSIREHTVESAVCSRLLDDRVATLFCGGEGRGILAALVSKNPSASPSMQVYAFHMLVEHPRSLGWSPPAQNAQQVGIPGRDAPFDLTRLERDLLPEGAAYVAKLDDGHELYMDFLGDEDLADASLQVFSARWGQALGRFEASTNRGTSRLEAGLEE